MAAQVIKNLQIKVSDIHVRYEDRYTNPDKPFSMGVTLKNLFFETTDENWKPCIIKETVKMIYKQVQLDCLSVYWNSNSPIYTDMEKDDMINSMKSNISSPTTKTDYKYLIEPISSVAQLRLNQKPEEMEYSLAKLFLNVIFKEIAIALSRKQYQDVMEMLESFERVALSSRFRQHMRPTCKIHISAKNWWKYAYRCILEETVRRRRRMWSWEHIKHYRDVMRQYKEAYKKKLSMKKISSDIQKVLDDGEAELSVFNITLMRQQAEVELKKAKIKKAKADEGGGWFGGWFGGGKKKEKEKKKEGIDIEEQFQELMTEEEKAKLYSAIGYQENTTDPTLPKDYVAHKLNFKLNKLSLCLKDEEKTNPQIVKLQLDDVFASVGQRPAANALRVQAKMDTLNIYGSPAEGSVRTLLSSLNHEADAKYSLLDVQFETNPLDGACDQRIGVHARPVEIIFDATTINQVVEFLKPPQSVHLKQLQAAAMSKFDEIKEQTTTGLAHAIDIHKYTDVNIDLKPSYILIPQDGYYRNNCHMLVVDLGNFQFKSMRDLPSPTGPIKNESMDDVMSRAYDKFSIKLQSVQVLFAHPGENWMAARQQNNSNMHIVRPISLNVSLHKCMIENDTRMPKMKIAGELPVLSLNVSDVRLQELLDLALSIPTPESSSDDDDEWAAPDITNLAVEAEAKSLLKKIQVEESSDEEQQAAIKAPSGSGDGADDEDNFMDAKESLEASRRLSQQSSQDIVQYTDLELTFEIKEISVNISQFKVDQEVPTLKIVVESLGTSLKMRTFEMVAEAYLGGVYLQHLQFKLPKDLQLTEELNDGPLINIINTPSLEDDSSKHLLSVQYLKANKEGPDFATVYNNTEQTIKAEFRALDIMLHQGALLNIMELAQSLAPKPRDTATTTVDVTQHTTDKQDTVKEAKPKRKKKINKKDEDVIDIQLDANLNNIAVTMCTDVSVITKLKVSGLEAGVTIDKKKTDVSAILRDITVFDPTPQAVYPKILSIDGSEVFNLSLTMFNDATEGEAYTNMKCVDMKVDLSLGCMKAVFLNKFVAALLGYVEKFSAAKDKVVEAGVAAAEQARQVAANLQDKASRIQLGISMKAPLIIVPQNSMSENALVADLGLLHIGNSFYMAQKTNERGHPAIFDHMKIELSDLKLSRAVLLDGQVGRECLLLNPVTISLEIQRNLAAAWYHEEPDINISGKLPYVDVNISQSDFTMMMCVLGENLTEGQPAPQAPPPVDTTDQVVPEIAAPVSAEHPGIEPPVTDNAYPKMTFTFCVENIKAELYIGDSELVPGGSARIPEKSLARVELNKIAVDGKMMSDTSMKAKVVLQNIILDDSRPLREHGITKMLEMANMGVSEDNNMVNISFDQDSKQNKDLKMTMHNPYICVCLDYLMAVGDFFIKGLPPPPPQPAKPAIKDAAAEADVVKAEIPPSSEMHIMIQIMHPEIVLVEDAMNMDTKALVLDTEVYFKMTILPEQQTMMGAVKNLQILSCNFSERSRRSKTGVVILTPCEIALQSSAPFGKGHHMDINISDIILNISPATIRLITAITSTVGSQQSDEEVEKVEVIPKDVWDVKPLTSANLWYLSSPEGEEVTEETLDLVDPLADDIIPPSRGEQLLVAISTIIVKIEGGIGKRTVPMLILEAGFRGEIKDWSTQLNIQCDLSLEVAYYNENMVVWEPLIEPVEDGNRHRPWELNVEISKNDDLPPPPSEEDEGEVLFQPPKMSLNVTSYDVLQLTVTKTCIEVLTNLGKAFGDAYNLVEPSVKAGEVTAPYLLKNDTGMALTCKLDETFTMPPQAKDGHVGLKAQEELPLWGLKVAKLLRKQSLIKATQEGEKEKKILLTMEQFNATRELNIMKVEERGYSINQIAYPGKPWSLICQTSASYGCKTITLRSMLQFHNHLPVDLEVYYKLESGDIEQCGVVAPDQTFNVPMYAVYSSFEEFFFKPADKNYKVSTTAIKWSDLKTGSKKVVSCEFATNESTTAHQPLYFNVNCRSEDVFFEQTEEKTAKSIMLDIQPTVVFHNLLPYKIQYTLEGKTPETTIDCGEKSPLLSACPGQTTLEVKISNYLKKEWTACISLTEKVEELSVITFEAMEGSNKHVMDLGLHTVTEKGYMNAQLYCPYWMINKCNLPISYKAGKIKEKDKAEEVVISHPADFEDAVLFSFKSGKSFVSKKKAALKVCESDWSDKFSLDTVGSSGIVQCRFMRYMYEVGVSISLSSSGLTKIVTFTPYYMLANHAKFTISCRERITEAKWIDVAPGECVPFWPIYIAKNMQMTAKIKDTDLETKPFPYNEVHATLMKVEEYGGIQVECIVSESAIAVTFQQYSNGMASARIVNHTENAIVQYSQREVKDDVQTLQAQNTCLYTWQDPLAKRKLIWSCGDKKFQEDDLMTDGIGEFFANADTKVYWVSFLDGMQRVLLFTEDLALATMAQEAGELERVEQEIILSLQGVGISLTNNMHQTEVSYMGITSSGVIWEEKKKRYKALNKKQIRTLEAAYQTYMAELSIGKSTSSRQQLDGKLDVDFQEMMMYKPRKHPIRRSFENGIWLSYRTSPHQLQLHAKVHRLQLDNQLPASVFPTVLAPVPPPKSVAADSVPKPFAELSVMLRKREHSNVMQFKYAKMLVQEMALKLDQGFLNALIDLFSSGAIPEEQELEYFRNDTSMIRMQLKDTDASLSSHKEQKNFYDILHVSPLKIHISFSLQGGGGDKEGGKPTQIQSNIINLFLQSVGVVLTDIQDVVFKLGYFERQAKFYNSSQLQGEVVRHYSGQAIKQMYVLVLGLDVLGNPFGLIRGMMEGVEDLFYEPYQGAIQGPEEFAEGLVLGVRSLFGHAVGGAAGAVSRITGTLGKGIAALTLDDDYQRKRREAMNKRPANFQEGMARGGKGLVMGFVDGITGIVRKPMEGAKQEGAEGFFKGLGKGLVGVVARPTSGVIDFASSSFEGVKRLAELSDEVRRLRPPRFIAPDGVIRPYIHREAEGNSILQELEKGKYALTDVFVAHMVVTKDGKNVVLVTDKRVIFVKKGDIFGHWDCEWQYGWLDLKEPPASTSKGIQILLKEKQKKSFFSQKSLGKMIPMTDEKASDWIVLKMKESYSTFVRS
ncbi:unnamed protein product [Owenia fusiformis]|uniref:Uncharacterized protein n=1 Tax=Owenia fusiformis TaxID=6347 RepID=A0A8J1TT07_OWEFU|nr:unnamed protein product [Owenia fusiformis]